MIYFLHPEAFLLALPVLFLLRRRFAPRPLIGVLRVMILFLVLGLLAGPYIPGANAGRDLVFVVDRSRSVPEHSMETVKELAQLAGERTEPGDRIGMVTFGENVAVDHYPTDDYVFSEPSSIMNRDGSDLGSALETALSLFPPGRQGSILVLSDGEFTGADPSPQARQALRRGIRLDAAWMHREGTSDAAVKSLALPGEVSAGEPFQFCSWVQCEKPVEAAYTVYRNGSVISEGRRKFSAGLNTIVCRDRLTSQGIHRYEVKVDIPDDRIVENNHAAGVTRVTGPRRILCVTPGGREDRLTRSLHSAGLTIVTKAPEAIDLNLNVLDGFRAVVLENVPAADLSTGAIRNLARYVEDLGGGLLMTGGRASFGPGGYHRSQVEEVLPVSMEIRKEQRKYALAMAIALDRSGSMAMPAGMSGDTKMDLANKGACAAVDLLSAVDSVSVTAVDSAPHTVLPLTKVQNKSSIKSKIRTIRSMGGGIFTFTAIKAAASELAKATQGTRHMVIFADAADAEEPGSYRTFVPKLVKAGVTVSVIGLGYDTDTDAAFLKDIAKLGNGRCLFCADPSDLPRVFATETIQVARSSFVTEPAATKVMPVILALGDLLQGGFPQVAGYSIAYAKPRSQTGVLTLDEQQAPLVSFWQCGLGRAAAFLGEADGQYSGGLESWNNYAVFFDTLVRWLAGNRANEQVFATVRRQGHQGVVTVEVEEGMEAVLDRVSPRLVMPDGRRRQLFFHRIDERRAEARFSLSSDGVYRAAIQVQEPNESGRTMGFVRLPPLTLPYSPEFELRSDPREGEKLLKKLATIGEGTLNPQADELIAGSRESRGMRSLSEIFAWCAVSLLLLEILFRRLHLHVPVPNVQKVTKPLRKLKRKRKPAKEKAVPKTTHLGGAAEVQDSRKQEKTQEEAAASPESPQEELGSVLQRAKKRADKRRN